ncbi:hypothetical protein QE152_g32496 [Popillia japonica]|uniref:Uncharacterized protein n=1 Tax=Popillia japonica TaxID=7064 RepID=A0AAW1IYT2_POPJA
MASFSVSRNTGRWPMGVFFAMLTIAAINAQIIYFENEQKEIRDGCSSSNYGMSLLQKNFQEQSVKTKYQRSRRNEDMAIQAPILIEWRLDSTKNADSLLSTYDNAGNFRILPNQTSSKKASFPKDTLNR